MNILTFLLILLQVTAAMPDNRVITTLKYSRVRVKPVIVNGKPAQNVEVPYIVSLKTRKAKIDVKNYNWTNVCGGSIIGKSKVLTAAHCFEDHNFYHAKRFDLLGAAAGSIFSDLVHDGTPVTTPAGQWRKLEGVRLHPHFHFPQYDIAMVYVTPNWYFTDNVKPIPLARKNVDYTKNCFTAGYGRLGYEVNSARADVLLLAEIRPFTKLQCSVIWEVNMNSFVCTYSALSDISRGDSGGPLVCKGSKEAPHDALLVGVVSGKNFDKTTLFTRVSAYKDWIADSGGRGTLASLPLLIIALLLYLVFHFTFPLYQNEGEHERKPTPKNTLWGTLCGGSIIAPTKVLTAAHCFDYKDYSQPGNRAKLRAVAGDLRNVERHDLSPENQDLTTPTQWRRVSSIVKHHDYNFPNYDIALIFIKDPWILNGYVQQITPAKSTADYLNGCIASGYGNLAHSKGSRASMRLLTAKLYVLPRHECSKLWDMDMDGFLCTRATYSDVAQGDSGGPLVCRDTAERPTETSKGLLVGVVSGKNFDKTTLFTRVSAYKQWIDTDCGFILRSNVLCMAITVLLL